MKFYVIGDPDTVLGFRLAGIEGRVADSPEAAREALKNAFTDKEIGVVVIPERIAMKIGIWWISTSTRPPFP